jgi:hypothetical protein
MVNNNFDFEFISDKSDTNVNIVKLIKEILGLFCISSPIKENPDSYFSHLT